MIVNYIIGSESTMYGDCVNGDVVGYEPHHVDLVIYAGDDFLFGLVVYKSDGTLADLTGATAAAQLRRTPGDAEIVAELGASIEVTNPARPPSTIVFTLDHDATTALPLESLVWDAQLTSATGMVATIAAGRVRVIGDVTRPAAAVAF